MLQARLYRGTLLFAILALVVLLFSVVSRPEPLQPETSLEPFDEIEAAADARRLIEAAPERLPGSADGAAAAEFVAAELESMDGGSVSERSFEASYDGSRVELTNVSLTLPGETDEVVVIAAPRDCAGGPCAASSAASTGALLELARGISRGHHQKTFELVSTDGSVAGAAGARQLAEDLAHSEVTAIVVLSGAGVREPRGRTVVPWSTSTRGTSVQLLLSAEEAVRAELSDDDPLPRSTFSELVRLAIPAGLGEQAPLVGEGYPAIGLAGGGPGPLVRAEDERMSTETLGAMGRTTLTLVRALDEGPAELESGPGSRVPLAGKLVPGWALTLLAGALLIPIAVVAVDAAARAGRHRAPLMTAGLWVLEPAVALFGVLVLAVLMGRIGLLPAPPFPFDPEDHVLAFGSALALVLMLAAAVAGTSFAERVRPHPGSEPAVTAASALALAVGGFAIWLMNPYLALVLAPALHIWLVAAIWGTAWSRAIRTGLVLLGFGAPLILLALLGAQFGTGLPSAFWQAVLLYTGGQLPLMSALPPAVVAAAAIAAARTPGSPWTDVRAGSSHGFRPRRPIQTPRHGRRTGQNR